MRIFMFCLCAICVGHICWREKVSGGWWVALLCVIGAGLLSGCNTINPIVAADNAMVIKDTQAANDNLVVSISASICEVPIGAVIRNPAFVPIATAACMPGGQAASASAMMQNMVTNPGLPAYQQVIDAHAPVSANLPTPAPSSVTVHAPVHPVRSTPYIPTVKQSSTVAPAPVVTYQPAPVTKQPQATLSTNPAAPAFGTLPGGVLP